MADVWVPSRVSDLVDGVDKEKQLAAQGILSETFDPASNIGNSSPGLSTMVGGLVRLKKGQQYTGGGILVGTSNTVTSAWLVLYRTSDLAQLAITANSAAIVGSTGLRPTAWTSAYTPTADETAWVCALMAGGTAAALARGNNGFVGSYVGVNGGVRRFIQQSVASPPASVTPADTTYAVYGFVY